MFYYLFFAAFLFACACLSWGQHKLLDRPEAPDPSSSQLETQSTVNNIAIRKFKIKFFSPLALAYAADWLQAPYIYVVYKVELNLDERLVSGLFATGFISAAVGGLFVGTFADKYGRRTACEVYCLTYTLSCLSMFSENLAILIIGRGCGGVSTSILFNAFEAWMIAEYHKKDLSSCGLSLENTLSQMATTSALSAIISGLGGEAIIAVTHSQKAPFLGSVLCLLIAGLHIQTSWDEHYGDKSTTNVALEIWTRGLRPILHDPSLLGLTVVISVFEGSLYLFVFSWIAMLRQAHQSPLASAHLPTGIMFSSFMCAMMFGAMTFESFMTLPSYFASFWILPATVGLSGCCFVAAVLFRQEIPLFLVFCLYEASIGLYYPTIALLKATRIRDGDRAKIYAIMRVPLNVYVLVGLSLADDSKHYHNNLFLACGCLLAVASGVAYYSCTRGKAPE